MTPLDDALAAVVRRVVREELAELRQALEKRPSADAPLTPEEAAAIAGVGAAAIRKWVREGSLPALYAGRRIRIERAALETRLRVKRGGGAGGDSGDSGGEVLDLEQRAAELAAGRRREG